MPKVEAGFHRKGHGYGLLRPPRFVTERGERHTFEYDRQAPSIALRASSSGSQTFVSSSDARRLYAMLGKIYEPHPRPASSSAGRLRPGEASTLPQLDRPAVTDPEHILYPSEPERGDLGTPMQFTTDDGVCFLLCAIEKQGMEGRSGRQRRRLYNSPCKKY